MSPVTAFPQARARRAAPRCGGRGLRAERPMGTSGGLGSSPRTSRKCWSWTSRSSKRESRAIRSPRGITLQLARLHLQRAPVGGTENEDLEQAEAHARRSLALRTAHNGETLQVLASALMGQHRFAEAREAGRAAAGDGLDLPDGAVASRRDRARARRLHGGGPHFRHPAHGPRESSGSLRDSPGGRRSVAVPLTRGGCCATRCIRRPDGTACPARSWPGSTGGWAISRCGKAGPTRRERELRGRNRLGAGRSPTPGRHGARGPCARPLARGDRSWRACDREDARPRHPRPALGELGDAGRQRPQRGVRARDGQRRGAPAQRPQSAMGDAPAGPGPGRRPGAGEGSGGDSGPARHLRVGPARLGALSLREDRRSAGTPARGPSRWTPETRRSTSTPE